MLRSGEEGAGGTRFQFPAPGEVEGPQGSDAMAGDLRPRTDADGVQRSGEERRKEVAAAAGRKRGGG